MNKKVTTVLQIVMFYISFMAPFVLKSNVEREIQDPERLLRKKRSGSGLGFFIIIVGFAGLTAAFGAVVLIALGIAFAAIVVIAFISAIFGGRKKRYLTGVVRRDRALSKNVIEDKIQRGVLQDQKQVSENELIEDKKKAIIERIQRHTQRLSEKLKLENKMNEATKVSIGDMANWALKKVNLIEKFPIIKPLSKEELQKAINRLFSQELDDIKELEKKIATIEATLSKTPELIFPAVRKERRRGMKLRIERAVDLIQTNVYREKKEKSSFAYKSKLYKIELDPLMKARNEEKDENKRKEIEEKIGKIMNRNEGGKTDEEVSNELQDQVFELYIKAGITESQMESSFFFSYSRAFLITLMRFEQIDWMNRLKDTPLNAYEKKQIDETIKKIEDHANSLLTDVDLK